MAESELPDKLFFKIGEVATIIGVRPHVLRYWESEFAALRPMKTRGSHRVYRRRDVELAMLVRRLLQDEGFTIAGAKKRLEAEMTGKTDSNPSVTPSKVVVGDTPAPQGDDKGRQALIEVREQLREILTLLDRSRG